MSSLTKSVLWLVILTVVTSVLVGAGITVAAAGSVSAQSTSNYGGHTSTSLSMTAAFACSPVEASVDTPITCSANLSAGNSTIEAVQWGFGDGTTASGTVVTHRYDQPGTYTVFLSVTGAHGSTTTAQQKISIRAANQPPTAIISCTPEVVTVGDTATCSAIGSSDDRGIQSFDWIFANSAIKTGKEVSHTYTTPGNQTVRLTITDSDGATDTVEKAVTVEPNKPPAAAISCNPPTIKTGQRFSCTATQSTDSDGSIESIRWKFGDGTTDSGSDVHHRYNQHGTYTVTATVTDDSGGSSTATTKVTVNPNAQPTANISHKSLPLVAGRSVQFEAEDVRDPDGTVASVEWQFADGHSKHGTDVSHQFESGGDYTVAMTLIDDYGRQQTVRQTITVNPAPRFTIEQTPTQPRTGQDVVLSADGELDGYQFSWDTDSDGENESRGREVVTSFNQPGQKPISVVATTPYGVTERRSTVLTVQNNAEFHLSSQQSSAEPGENIDLAFSVSNQVNNESISAKLQLDTPSGLSVSDISGPGITTVQSTDFITVDAGATERLQLGVEAAEPGTYRVGGAVVYYYAGQETRRKTAVDPVVIEVQDRESNTPASDGSDSNTSGSTNQTADDTPGFGFWTAILALVVGTVVARRSEQVDSR